MTERWAQGRLDGHYQH